MTVQDSAAPVITIAPDVDLPVVGFGTYLIGNSEVEDSVASALAAGYRHVDTAEAYENEEGVGRAVRAALEAGFGRGEVFITTKLFPATRRGVHLRRPTTRRSRRSTSASSVSASTTSTCTSSTRR